MNMTKSRNIKTNKVEIIRDDLHQLTLKNEYDVNKIKTSKMYEKGRLIYKVEYNQNGKMSVSYNYGPAGDINEIVRYYPNGQVEERIEKYQNHMVSVKFDMYGNKL